MLRALARGKINWTLDILGRRNDGYHQMDMLMQPVELHDTLSAELSTELSLSITGAAALAAEPKENLVLKAARLLREETGCLSGAQLTLTKRIPIGAGMGGGSADAAAALLLLDRLWGLRLPRPRLLALALRCGADVPFLLQGGLARVSGIGERIRPLLCAPETPLVVVQPCEGLSTGAIFTGFDAQTEVVHPQTDRAEEDLLCGDLSALRQHIGNVLQPVSAAQRPAIAEASDRLTVLGAECAMMTGSGSAVFGAFSRPEAAESAYQTLKERWDKTWLTRTCGPSVVLEEYD